MFCPSVNLETPRPSIPLTVPQTYINYEHLSSPHQGTFDVSMSSYPETGENQFSIRTFQDDWSVLSPGRMETSHHHHHLRHHSTNTSLSESLTGDIVQDETNIVTIKFSSRSRNSQSFDNNPTPTTSGERSGEWKKKDPSIKGSSFLFFIYSFKFSVNSSPIREQRPSSSHLLQSQTEEDGSGGSVQTQFRFQEPLVPEDQTTSTGTSPVHTRELSVVNVKWDSERKRRQGYFAQEEGAEKSPFRHYNKSNCDFESWWRLPHFHLFRTSCWRSVFYPLGYLFFLKGGYSLHFVVLCSSEYFSLSYILHLPFNYYTSLA